MALAKIRDNNLNLWEFEDKEIPREEAKVICLSIDRLETRKSLLNQTQETRQEEKKRNTFPSIPQREPRKKSYVQGMKV